MSFISSYGCGSHPFTDTQLLSSSSSLISLFNDDEARWNAVRSRDANADGFFVYGVRSTRIYCRPICKARLARRANVRFYQNPDEAREAGFRACKRCKPEEQGLMPEEDAVRKIRSFVAASARARDGQVHVGEVQRLSLGDMARKTGLSKWHFHRVFKKCVGVTPVEFIRTNRAASGGQERFVESDTTSTLSAISLPGAAAMITDKTTPVSAGVTEDMDWFRELDMMTNIDLDLIIADGIASSDSDTAGIQQQQQLDLSLPWDEFLLESPTANT